MKRTPTPRGFQILVGAALALAWVSTVGWPRHGSGASPQAQDLCSGPVVNPIACENSKPGNPSSQWDISGAGSASIQGFATDISVNRGQTIGFKVDTTATAFRIDIYRMGYYAGDGARLIATSPRNSHDCQRNQPDCLTDNIDRPHRLRQLVAVRVVGGPCDRDVGHLHREAGEHRRRNRHEPHRLRGPRRRRHARTSFSRPRTRPGRRTTSTAATACTSGRLRDARTR